MFLEKAQQAAGEGAAENWRLFPQVCSLGGLHMHAITRCSAAAALLGKRPQGSSLAPDSAPTTSMHHRSVTAARRPCAPQQQLEPLVRPCIRNVCNRAPLLPTHPHRSSGTRTSRAATTGTRCVVGESADHLILCKRPQCSTAHTAQHSAHNIGQHSTRQRQLHHCWTPPCLQVDRLYYVSQVDKYITCSRDGSFRCACSEPFEREILRQI